MHLLVCQIDNQKAYTTGGTNVVILQLKSELLIFQTTIAYINVESLFHGMTFTLRKYLLKGLDDYWYETNEYYGFCI